MRCPCALLVGSAGIVCGCQRAAGGELRERWWQRLGAAWWDTSASFFLSLSLSSPFLGASGATAVAVELVAAVAVRECTVSVSASSPSALSVVSGSCYDTLMSR